MQKKGMLNTSKLFNIIRGSKGFAEVDACLAQLPERQSLGEYLYELMQKYGKQPKDIILLSGIERSYFYHILSGQKAPGRNILLRVCFCLGANLAETNQALRYAGHAVLYPKVRRDALLIFCIDKKYDMRQTNQALIEQEEAPLYLAGKIDGKQG